jgi:hypothetical protein
MRAHRELNAGFVLPARPMIVAGVVKDFCICIRRALKPAPLKVVFELQPITVSGGERFALHKAEFTSVSV